VRDRIDALQQAIVTPVFSFLSITYVMGFQPKKERTVTWIR